ncbi:MAG: hypothetical protein GC192_01815 [Bacteroidetes bacterium]|nr:hypothetical protein [Bacteroidota bacterium]
MTVGLIGLDNKGILLAQILLQHKITVVAFDGQSENRKRSAEMGIVTTSSIQAVAMHLPSPRIIWNMVDAPYAIKDTLLLHLSELLSPGDVVVDGIGTGKENQADILQILNEKGVLLLFSKLRFPLENSKVWINGDATAFNICKPIFDIVFSESYQYMGAISSF